jgi:hypothetical protein
MTTLSITSGQEKQYKRLVEDAAERALQQLDLDKDSMQRLIESGDDFQAAIVSNIRELSNSNRFASEEMASHRGYPNGYKARSLEIQIETLCQHFPQLALALTGEFLENVLRNIQLPNGAEDWYAIPRWERISDSYNAAAELLLQIISSTRELYNYRQGWLGPEHLLQHKRTVQMLSAMSEQQKGDILIIPAQFGKRHAGRSVRRAREHFTSNEFGLDMFTVGIMLLTHPERLQTDQDLSIDCAGDDFTLDSHKQFDRAPIFFFERRLRFDAYWTKLFVDNSGSATGFLPSSMPQTAFASAVTR